MILSTYSRLPPPGTDGSARLPNTTPTFADDGSSLPQIDAVAGIGAEVVNKELTTDYNKGPLNPVAMLPPRLVKKILTRVREIHSVEISFPTPGTPPNIEACNSSIEISSNCCHDGAHSQGVVLKFSPADTVAKNPVSAASPLQGGSRKRTSRVSLLCGDYLGRSSCRWFRPSRWQRAVDLHCHGVYRNEQL